jgi:hypothetical protein
VTIDSCVCVSPPFQRNGSVSVEVSFDGGQVQSDNSLSRKSPCDRGLGKGFAAQTFSFWHVRALTHTHVQVWSQQAGNKFHYYTSATLDYAIPSAAPLRGGTIITVFTAYNHTFVSLPRLALPCFSDSFRASAGQGATFDMHRFRYASTEPGPCPCEVVTRQHDLPRCIFVDAQTGNEVMSEEARIIAMDAIECTVPDLRALLQGTSGGDSTHLILQLYVTLDGGQHRFQHEPDVGIQLPLPFLGFADPLISLVSPDTGPITESTEITLRGSNLSPPTLSKITAGPASLRPDPAGKWGWGGGRGAEGGLDVFGTELPGDGVHGRARSAAQQVRCWVEAGAGPDAPLRLRQVRARFPLRKPAPMRARTCMSCLLYRPHLPTHARIKCKHSE